MLRKRTGSMEQRGPFYQIIDGLPRCPNVDPVLVRKALNFKASKGDLVQWSFPKSGTHWVQYIIQLILNEGEGVENYDQFSENSRPMEYVGVDNWRPALALRCFLTHLPPQPEFMSNDAKYVYVARNPWDVCVSLFHMATNLSVYRFEDGTFDEFFEYFLNKDIGYGSYFDHVATGYALKDRANVLFLTYEQLKREPRDTVLKLARFLGDRHGKIIEDGENGLLARILELSSPSQMKSVIVMNLRSKEWDVMMTRNNMTCKDGYGGDCRKYAIVRNAQIGDWKNYFKPDQLQRFEAKIKAEGEKALFMDLWADIRKEALELAFS
ncbi:sulfotransferase 1C2-like isoform X1 [Dermacentor variabilis]|uniref:sulfotransferase 1C2-like isoform X1 n=2 Tax=Dermacentor variabilis TaxID=34621 RepID=UPI003F5B5800